MVRVKRQERGRWKMLNMTPVAGEEGLIKERLAETERGLEAANLKGFSGKLGND